MGNMNIKEKILNMDLKKLVYIPIAAIPVFVLVNRFEYFSVSFFLLLLVVSIIVFLRSKEISAQHLRVDIWFLALVVFIIVSYLASGQSILDMVSYGFIRHDGNLFFSYLPFLIFAVPFLDYKKALRIYFWFLFISFAFFSIMSLFEYLNGHHFLMIRIDDYYVGPMMVALNNSHNATGSVFSIVSIFAASFFLKSDNKKKISYGLIVILCLAALAITKSRGSLVAFVIGAFFVLLVGSGSFLKFLRNVLIMSAVAVPLVFITGTFQRITQIFKIYDISALTRLALWEKAIYLFKQSPLIGIGFGRYNDVAWNFDRVPLSGIPGVAALYTAGDSVFNTTNAHSSYLHFLAEIGILGLFLVLGFWILCFVFIYQGYRRTKSAFSEKVYLSAMGGIVTLFALALTEDYMTAPTVMLCLSMVTSLAIGLTGMERSEVQVK